MKGRVDKKRRERERGQKERERGRKEREREKKMPIKYPTRR